MKLKFKPRIYPFLKIILNFHTSKFELLLYLPKNLATWIFHPAQWLMLHPKICLFLIFAVYYSNKWKNLGLYENFIISLLSTYVLHLCCLSNFFLKHNLWYEIIYQTSPLFLLFSVHLLGSVQLSTQAPEHSADSSSRCDNRSDLTRSFQSHAVNL